jgi:hypothetical protein
VKLLLAILIGFPWIATFVLARALYRSRVVNKLLADINADMARRVGQLRAMVNGRKSKEL